MSSFLPISAAEMHALGWSDVDFVFVTGDAYVDHPSFAAALLARVLEAEGLRIGVLAQPDWNSCEAWMTFGRPRLGFCVSAGNMDSMINHYTAAKKVRNEDAYSPGGAIGRRPDRATLAYCRRAHEAYPGIPVIVGGVEASLRRLSHYDFWSDKVRRPILFDSKADLLVYGMGETPLLEIARRLQAGKPLRNESDGRIADDFRTIRGTAFRIGASEDLPEETPDCVHLPSHEEVVEDKRLFAEMTKLIYDNLNPSSAATLVQQHVLEAVVVNPPALPLTEAEMDRIYDLPFTRRPHPSYGETEIPAFGMIRNSITVHRGCFGGCAFCSIAAHQGRTIQSRSVRSVCGEVKKVLENNDGEPEGKATSRRNPGNSRTEPSPPRIISDLGGPTANMYKLGCTNEAANKRCRRLSCLVPQPCAHLNVDHSAVIALMRKVRQMEGVEQVYVASGVRTDLAMLDPRYVDEIVQYHIGGRLKTAPEHTDPKVLALANKPPIENYDVFCERFHAASHKAGKTQHLVPYLIAGLPGSTLRSMVAVAEYLKEHDIRPEQVQEFIPGPFELASCMYHTGIDPFTGKEVYTAHGQRERRLQKALLLYHDPAYYHDVKSALKEAHREDLIGTGPHCLIPPYPVRKEAALRQTARVKRLQRNQRRDKELAEKKRAELLEESRPVIKPPREKRDFAPKKPQHSRDGERSFERRERPKRDGERSFEQRERPKRDGERSFERRERPQRDGERSFERRERPQRDGERSFERRERPQRDGERSRPGGPKRFGKTAKKSNGPRKPPGRKGGR